MDRNQIKLFNFRNIERLKTILSIDNVSTNTKAYKKNEIIHFTGDSCQYLSLIIEGAVDIRHTTSDGREITMNTLTKNQMYGEILLFATNNQFPYDIVAISNNTTIKRINKNDLINGLAYEPDLLLGFLNHLSESYMKLNRYIKLISQKTLNKKIAYYLLEYKNISEKNTKAYLESKTKLADFLGVERPSLVRELTKLKKQSILDYDKDKITVTDLKRLKLFL